jgi:hypothetical protein
MKKSSTSQDELRKEYDPSKLKKGVVGKYHRRATAATNLVLIEPELSQMFPDSDSVNRALRLLAQTAQLAAAGIKSKRRA